jgi:hypothetical protein
MLGFRTLDLILLLVIGYLLWDKLKNHPSINANKAVVPINGASTNTAPNIIDNGSGVGDTFDLQVDALTKQLGY